MPPLRTVSRDTPKGRHFTKKQPLKGAVFCFQRRRAESRFPAAVQSAAAVQSCHSRSVPQQPFSPAAAVQSRSSRSIRRNSRSVRRHSRSILPQSFNSAAVVQSATAVQSRCNRSVSQQSFSPPQSFSPATAFRIVWRFPADL